MGVCVPFRWAMHWFWVVCVFGGCDCTVKDKCLDSRESKGVPMVGQDLGGSDNTQDQTLDQCCDVLSRGPSCPHICTIYTGLHTRLHNMPMCLKHQFGLSWQGRSAEACIQQLAHLPWATCSVTSHNWSQKRERKVKITKWYFFSVTINFLAKHLIGQFVHLECDCYKMHFFC